MSIHGILFGYASGAAAKKDFRIEQEHLYARPYELLQ